MLLAMTQAQVARKSNVSRAFYCEIELGTKNPSVESAKRISKVLGFEWVLFFENKCRETQQNERGNRFPAA